MSSSASVLYEPLISRDLENIAPAIRRFLNEDSVAALETALARFAVLAYAPTEHARHAIFAIASAAAAIETFPDHSEEILAACARYTASSRLPWSEPPIPDPPRIDDATGYTSEKLRQAVADGDRLEAERWLAANFLRPDFPEVFFAAAAEDLADFGHKLTVAVHAWKLAAAVPPPHRFAILRIAPWEWTAYRGDDSDSKASSRSMSMEQAVRACVQSMESGEEGLVDFHWLELLDAALEVSAITGSSSVQDRVLACVSSRFSPAGRETGESPLIDPVKDGDFIAPSYDLSRDYAGYLQSFAIGKRLERAIPGVDCQRIIRAAHTAMANGLSFEESL
ncbi:MAG TPA: hypothetical protein VHL58_01080 [Thermoanaerobaculia bacterium]|nr:hypothetical protein [Thermoanaerobaculia bacterium]